MTMRTLEDLEKRVVTIEKRNSKVELDKAWETSWTRRGLLILFTYLSVGFYMQAIGISSPWLNAIIPSLGFLLSTLTLPFFKRIWLKIVVM
ncbi:MAG: hypothetical protein UY49_C0026G0006 [Microgenomates group bacterium GW2011_GWC1_49_7]|nr:MAG: hypothetical protein UY49_C0026G0006 [Microgenomates group bacterium GW2011_GWC1_49_7]